MGILPDLERNQDKVLFSERIRKIFFLLSAKGSENDKGGIFRVAPFVNPKTPHTPIDGKRVRGKNPPPCLRGQKGNVNKRTNEMGGKHLKDLEDRARAKRSVFFCN